MQLQRLDHLVHITSTLTNTLTRPYVWRNAEDIVPGDVFLTDSGKFAGEVLNVYIDDGEGVWIDDTMHEGYVDFGQKFRVAR